MSPWFYEGSKEEYEIGPTQNFPILALNCGANMSVGLMKPSTWIYLDVTDQMPSSKPPK